MKKKTKVTKLDYAFKEIPKGFVRMKMGLTFDEGKQEDIIENQILKMLVRDYYILYSKKIKFKGKKWIEFDFYCQPHHETMIAYRFGIYAQIMMGWSADKDKIVNAIHNVPDGFPACIRIKSPKEDL